MNDIANKYTVENPAESIGVLLEALSVTSDVRYLYRGQTTDYPTIVPSGFRHGIFATGDPLGWMGLSNSKRWKSLDDRAKIRAKVKTGLLHIFGKGIGNVIAQQYGLSSEVLDLTSSIKVAAFFATTTFPSYAHHLGDQNNKIGVIYRLPMVDRQTSLEHLEGVVHLMTLHGYQGVDEIHFHQRVAVPALQSEGNSEALLALKDYFENNGSREDILTTNTMEVEFHEVKSLYQEIPTGATLPTLNSSRLSAQSAGFLYPLIQHRCLHPTKLKLHPAHRHNNFYAQPSLVAILDSVAIHNVKAHPELQAFYFYHSDEEVSGISREALWPTTEKDELRRYVEGIASEIGSVYLKSNNVTVADPQRGIIDPGFFD